MPTTDDPALSETTVRHAKEDFLPLKDAAASARVRRHALRSMFVGRGTFWLSRHNDEVERFYPGAGLRCLDIVVKSRSSMKSIKGKHDPGND